MKFELYREAGGRSALEDFLQGNAGDWRWRLRADNNQTIATSGEGYRNRLDCLHAVELVMSTTAATVVVDTTTGNNVVKGFIGGWN